MSASPTVATIRNGIVSAVKTALNATPSLVANVVHDYERFWRDQQKFNSLFNRTDTGWVGKLNGWMINKVSTREEHAPEWFRVYLIHKFQLDGFMGIQDTGKTEKDFIDQMESICDGLRLNTTVFTNWEMTTPVAHRELIERITIGDATCWHGVITLEAESIENKFT